ncbi:MAG: hypothetical protein CME25_09970 [Gemmatimonadetes bacterium]|nr:hypothetical protein [Gemmatimonadota bacterium]
MARHQRFPGPFKYGHLRCVHNIIQDTQSKPYIQANRTAVLSIRKERRIGTYPLICLAHRQFVHIVPSSF